MGPNGAALAAVALALALRQIEGPVLSADVEPPPGLLEVGDATVELRDAPTPAAAVTTTITRESADSIQLARVRVVTRVAGRVRAVSADARVTGSDFGTVTHVAVRRSLANEPAVDVPIPTGQLLTLLQDTERGCFVRLDGRVIDAVPCPAGDPGFEVESRPRVEWWGFLRLSDGRSGWTLIARHGPE
jgi:hypothetical protein